MINMFEEKPPIIVELEGRDRLCRQSKMGKMEVQLVGCHELLMMVKKLREQHGDDPVKWPVPEGQCHSSLLLKKFISSLLGQWAPPYQHAELCHCRTVPTSRVEAAIISGAHRAEVVSRLTSAGTACGTCKPDIEAMIQYYLSSSKKSF